MTTDPSGNPLRRQLVSFGLIGVGSTLLYLVLFAGFSTVMHNQWANIVALVLCTVVNTALNRRFTFDAGHDGALEVHLKSLVLLFVTWSLTAAALWLLEHFSPDAGTLAATICAAIGNAVATVTRFVLLRRWFS